MLIWFQTEQLSGESSLQSSCFYSDIQNNRISWCLVQDNTVTECNTANLISTLSTEGENIKALHLDLLPSICLLSLSSPLPVFSLFWAETLALSHSAIVCWLQELKEVGAVAWLAQQSTSKCLQVSGKQNSAPGSLFILYFRVSWHLHHSRGSLKRPLATQFTWRDTVKLSPAFQTPVSYRGFLDSKVGWYPGMKSDPRASF